MVPVQTAAGPLMGPGAASGESTEIVKTAEAELPHTLLATTEISPEVDEAVALIELVVDEPDQPEGIVQV